MTRKQLLQELYTKRNIEEFEVEYIESLSNRTFEQEQLLIAHKALFNSYKKMIEQFEKEIVGQITIGHREGVKTQ